LFPFPRDVVRSSLRSSAVPLETKGWGAAPRPTSLPHYFDWRGRYRLSRSQSRGSLESDRARSAGSSPRTDSAVVDSTRNGGVSDGVRESSSLDPSLVNNPHPTRSTSRGCCAPEFSRSPNFESQQITSLRSPTWDIGVIDENHFSCSNIY
jgi:hypothetical protein